MAHIRKQRDKWRADVARMGVRVSGVFDTKAAATQWAAMEEAEILSGRRKAFPRKTFAQALDRYKADVSAGKEGRAWEEKRIEALKRGFPELAGKILSEIETPDLAAWRDERLKTVQKSTVQREINLLRNVFTVARDEWKWCGESPFKGLRMPGENPARQRLWTWREIRRVCRWLGYRTGRVATKQQEVAFALLVSLRTGMRSGEVLSLGRANTDMDRRVARVEHKTQHLTGELRAVPFTTRAARLLQAVADREAFFTITDAERDVLFREARDSLMLGNVRFHDARATALTLLARKVDVMTLAKISGHKDLRILLQVYYRESAEDIAKRLG